MTTAIIPADKRAEFLEIFERANVEKPKAADIKALRRVLADMPQAIDILGDFSKQAIERLLNSIELPEAGRVVLRADLDHKRQELGFYNSPMIEQLLIDAALIAWLRLNIYEQQLAAMDKGQGVSLQKAAFWDRRITLAQRRFLRACESLAKVRRLARKDPALQVNIATQNGQQVNFTGDLVRESEGR